MWLNTCAPYFPLTAYVGVSNPYALRIPHGANLMVDLPDPLLKPEDAAEILGCTTKHLEGLRCRGGGPRYVRLGWRTVRYRRSQLESWLASREFASTAQEAQFVHRFVDQD